MISTYGNSLMALTLQKQQRCFGGTVNYYSHPSSECRCDMAFTVFIPPQAVESPVPVLYFLSGLTCTPENFTVKAGAQRYAAEAGLMLVAPDTSPRGEHIPDDTESWDMGKGAGFYVDATAEPWRPHYRMYSYVTKELPALIAANFSILVDRQGIFGHSMGGHGALVCGLRNPNLFKSISAFAPIAAPSQCPWGKKALTQYLGPDPENWKDYDASRLIAHHVNPDRPILVDQGAADTFLTQQQLLPECFETACQQANQPLILRLRDGYDHSYFFIASFMGEHIRHHAAALCVSMSP